jgi:hypothetical protein
MVFSTLIGSAYCFFIIFQCGNPGSGSPFWEKRLSNQCVSPRSIIVFSYTHGIINAITDLAFAVIPIAAIQNAHISYREKVTICSILSLGITFVLFCCRFEKGCTDMDNRSGIAATVRIKWTRVLADNSLAFFCKYSLALPVFFWI